MKKAKQLKGTNAQWIKKADKLRRLGVSAAQAARDYLGCGESTAQAYFRILKKLWDGEPIPVGTGCWNEKALKEYCLEEGIEYNVKPPIEGKENGNEQLPGQVSMDEITAKGSNKNGSADAIPENVLEAQKRMVRAIGAYVWEMITEYMKWANLVEGAE